MQLGHGGKLPDVDEEEIDPTLGEEVFNEDTIFAVEKADINALWESKNPYETVAKLLQNYFDNKKEKEGKDVQKYEEFEKRYEDSEFKWITNFVVNNLIFLRSELGIKDPEALHFVMQVFWNTLDLFSVHDSSAGMEEAMAVRFNILRQGMTALVSMRVLSKEHVSKCLEFLRRTLFAHLQLYLVCMGNKQSKEQKQVTLFPEHPDMHAADLESECVEVTEAIDVREDRETPGELQSAAEGIVVEGEDVDEVIDPDEPLYGLKERLSLMGLDADSMEIIVDRLLEANKKVQVGLLDRQTNLENKMANLGAQAKKR